MRAFHRNDSRNPARSRPHPVASNRRSRWRNWLIGTAALLTGGPALAQETITYTYDALGRLVKVDHGTAGPNAGVAASYTYDSADNRKNVTVTGAPTSTGGGDGASVPSKSVFIVVPLNGYTLIKIQ